ncbi:MAG: TolC family protein [bacterium]|nr:TolC family protein [bacterium]
MSINKKILAGILLLFITSQSVFAIQNVNNKKTQKRSGEITLQELEKKVNKIKGSCGVVELHIPKVTAWGERPEKVNVMSIEDCVNYAIAHRHDLAATEDMIRVAESGIGQARSNYAPRLFANVNYNHRNSRSNSFTDRSNTLGFNVGISELIWDFGRTTARINMAQYDTLSAHYDHQYELLEIIYNVRINYYRVLMALANLDIYEQNVRINTLNYERTKAMFDEGLKSKIDVVNAEVNLTDAKIQLVEGQNNLETAVIALKDSIDYEEETEFIVKNTENFGFLKSDYRQKMRELNKTKPVKYVGKKNEDGLIMLSSGIEHNDFIQDYKFVPLNLTKQEAVDKAMKERPDLKSVRMVEKVQEESLKAIKKSYAPEITADLSWGYSRMENSMYSSPLQLGAGMSIGSVNPYGIHYQIKEGEAFLDIAKHNVNIALCDIFWEVQSNYIDMKQLERRIPLMHSKVKATLENFELADGRYSVGLNNYVELQDALANYNTSQLNYVQTVFEYNVARETLLKSMGVK